MSGINSMDLFKLLNTEMNKTTKEGYQVLDKDEVTQAKIFGFSLFDLEEDMTLKEFNKKYIEYIEAHPDDGVQEAEKQTKAIKVKLILKQYGAENLGLEPEEGETIEAFEARVALATGNEKTEKEDMGVDDKKVSVWLEAANAELEAEQDAALEPINWEKETKTTLKKARLYLYGSHPRTSLAIRDYVDKRYDEILAEKGEVSEEDLNNLEKEVSIRAELMDIENENWDRLMKEEQERMMLNWDAFPKRKSD